MLHTQLWMVQKGDAKGRTRAVPCQRLGFSKVGFKGPQSSDMISDEKFPWSNKLEKHIILYSLPRKS